MSTNTLPVSTNTLPVSSNILEPMGPAASIDIQREMFRRAGDDPDLSPYLRIIRWDSPGIVIGRFQKKEDVVDLESADELGIPVVRRFTGGGAVLVGPGQLGIVVVAREKDLPGNIPTSMEVICSAIVVALGEQGIPARLRAPNDIECGQKKLSGSAQARSRGAILHHATLLLEIDPALMNRVLIEDPGISKRWLASSPGDAVTSLAREGYELDRERFVVDLEGILGRFWARG